MDGAGNGSVGAVVTSGTTSRSETSTCGQHASIAGEFNCRRCGGAMLLATVLSGDKPRFHLFRCLACDYYERVEA
jgi:DNA-directed RNA polymerase subunit M/transcription elongation factor TFIIS